MVSLGGGGPQTLKRFYTSATTAPAAEGFAILLDGRPAKTPKRAPLAAPSRALAEAVAAEWSAAGATIAQDDLRLTRLVATAIDHAEQAEDWRREIARFAAHDLLCYRAEAPAALAARQAAVWDPYLAWARGAFGAPFVVATGVVAAPQPDLALSAIRGATAALSGWRVLGVKAATEILGSAVLALALERAAFAADDILAASRLDETFQAERWGRDDEAEARAARIADDFAAIARYLASL